MTLIKDGNPLYGEYNIESKEKITPPQQLSKKEKELNKENEFLKALEAGDIFGGPRAVNTRRRPTKFVSRGQRAATRGEKDGPIGLSKNRKQRKAIG